MFRSIKRKERLQKGSADVLKNDKTRANKKRKSEGKKEDNTNEKRQFLSRNQQEQ